MGGGDGSGDTLTGTVADTLADTLTDTVSDNIWRDRLVSLFFSPVGLSGELSDGLGTLPRRVLLDEMRILFLDEKGARLGAPLSGSVVMERAGDILEVGVIFEDPVGGDFSSSVSFTGAYDLGAGDEKVLSFDFSGLRPDIWHDFADNLWREYSGEGLALSGVVSGVSLPLAGAGELGFGFGELRRVEVLLSGSPGTVRVDMLYEDLLPIFAFGLGLDFSRDDLGVWRGGVVLEDMLFGALEDTGDLPVLDLEAEISASPGETFSFTGSFGLEDLSVEWLGRLWPDLYLSVARDWVEGHIEGGRLTESRVELSFSWRGRTPSNEAYGLLEDLRIDFSFADMDVRYLADFPLVSGAH
ncbi:MAG: hypothetical protein OD811_05320, partial [Alphaproteobacteria bacterium]